MNRVSVKLSLDDCPDGLTGEEFPLPARADVYDALTSKRHYKQSYDHLAAVETIKKGRGTHFQPGIVDAFLVVKQKFDMITQKLEDSESYKPCE
ncbi:MAG: hypothetical protein ABW148_13310 [Sedimenticola sp.]